MKGMSQNNPVVSPDAAPKEQEVPVDPNKYGGRSTEHSISQAAPTDASGPVPTRGQGRPEIYEGLFERPFDEVLHAVGDIHIFRQRPSDRRHKHPEGYEIFLSALQRMLIVYLQRQLVDVVGIIHHNMKAPDQVMEKAKLLLADYCAPSFCSIPLGTKLTFLGSAVQNYDFMVEKTLQSKRAGEADPFVISTTQPLGVLLMKDIIPDLNMQGRVSNVLKTRFPDAYNNDKPRYDDRKPILPGTSRHERYIATNLAHIYERLWAGISGGLALIGPMLIMILHNDLLTTLLTATVATLLFAIALSLAPSDMKAETVLSCVAAYAAVLVVFIGASS